MYDYQTLRLEAQGAVLFVTIDAPPMNLIGPELVRDLVSLIELLDRGEPYRVAVFRSADPDFFISHVDVTKVSAYRAEAARLTGEASIALLFRRLAETRAVTIAQIEGRARGAGSEFVLNCDMRFGARGRAILAQNEAAFGLIPGGGGAQHLVRMVGRGRALEILLSADDYDADLAERYGWINRSLDREEIGPFVAALAHRIARMPATGHAIVKERINAISLPPVEDYRRDSDLFGEGVTQVAAQRRIHAALDRGFQSREAEIEAGKLLGTLPD
ncbi:enoyl-CoA hydratase/isomerase family protein [Sphingomonas morindae]|uniref:Enoyl-CoA hydratase/isomerase family protein n=1 Tax=Sphingomonas morindae TaxID=1541170 RepID=A0ABY4X7U9_9SPHN|nr:enoyl-CoA hydratase/isomerase family protein [Sphingomonas morindae]USI72971.1 enoyl-CoA hydratase/isomerase family protein [Sphingomonas morindae]